MEVLPRLFHVPCRRAYTKQSFNLTQKLDRFNRLRTRLCNSLASLFGKFRFHDTERVAPPSEIPRSGARCSFRWTNGVCVIFHMELRFKLHHTSSRKCHNTWLRDLIDYRCEVVEWFCPSSLSKTSHGGLQVEDWALVMGSSPLFRVTDRRCCSQNAVVVTQKRSKQSFKICPYLTPRQINNHFMYHTT